MKRLPQALGLIFLLISCNPAPDRRTPLQLSGPPPALFNPANYYSPPTQINPAPSPQDQEEQEGEKEFPTTLAQGFAHCRFDSDSSPFRRSENQLGTIELCQNSLNLQQFLIRSELAHNAQRVCIFPSSRNQMNQTLPIGPQFCTLLLANQLLSFTLSINPDYQHLPLNGATVMLENQVSNYLNCFATSAPTQVRLQACYLFTGGGGFIDFNFL